MKYKLLSVENLPKGGEINIGDYIQALAAFQFLPSFDGFINRERLSEYDGDECAVIMNGWYMHFPEFWPPTKKIHPLFVAFHINSSVAEKMLRGQGLSYLKEHEPIGCRDKYTYDLLTNKGIKAWFSGCLTLTLGQKYLSEEKGDSIYFTDPAIPSAQPRWLLILDVLRLFRHPFLVRKLSPKLHDNLQISTFVKYVRTARFYRLYSRIFSKNVLANAIYIRHISSTFSNLSNGMRLNEAEKLIRLYAKAKFVVTSRIHCALPCLGLETPVYYTYEKTWKEGSTCRFGGLMELLHVVNVTPYKLEVEFDCTDHFPEDVVVNNDSWKPLAKRLKEICSDFIGSFE